MPEVVANRAYRIYGSGDFISTIELSLLEGGTVRLRNRDLRMAVLHLFLQTNGRLGHIHGILTDINGCLAAGGLLT
jgi:hypothetical protein